MSDTLFRCCRCCPDDDPEFHAENGIDAHSVSCDRCQSEQAADLLAEIAEKDAEIARLRAEIAAPGKVIGYMLYADSQFAETSFVGQSLTGSVMPDTKILDEAVAGWLKANPTARVVVVSEMRGAH